MLESHHLLFIHRVGKHIWSSGRYNRPNYNCAISFPAERKLCMRLPPTTAQSRRDAAASIALSALLLSVPPLQRTAVAAQYNPGESPEQLADALGGLKPGTGRPLNALIKFRAATGVERVATVDSSPLFKPGEILDNLRTANGGVAEVVFIFPPEWILSGGPNLDVRDVKQSDSAFVLVAPQPKQTPFQKLPDSFFLDVLFDPQGKYGQYGNCDDRKVVSSGLMSLALPSGGSQSYRRIDLKFAPLSYNANTVERRALISATSVGGSVFILVAGSLATRFKTMRESLSEVQGSFRALGRSAGGGNSG